MSKRLLLLLVAACNFGHNRILDNQNDAPLAPPIDAPDHNHGSDALEDHDAPNVASCTLLPQSGCSGATPACDLTAADDGTVACRAVTEPGTSVDYCADDTACAVGYTCTHDSNAADMPWCARFCDHDTDCSGTGSRCVIGLVGAQDQPLGVDVCSDACDLVAQTGCPSSMACYGYGSAAGDYTDCVYPGTIALGSACTNMEDCVSGTVCVDDGTTTTCEQYCLVGDDTTCPTDETCTEFTVPLTIGANDYGVCQ